MFLLVSYDDLPGDISYNMTSTLSNPAVYTVFSGAEIDAGNIPLL
jgi:hypothetical protein